MNKKIFITGPSGIGKTTLAGYIHNKYELPYISTSASAVWGKFGFNNHNEAHKQSVLNKEVGLAYQYEVLEQREKNLVGNSWVTDRSPIDNIAYFLLTLGHDLTEKETKEFIFHASVMLGKVNGIIHLQWCNQDFIEDNGKRILNSYYQEMVDSVVSMILNNIESSGIKVLKIKTWDLEERKKLVDQWLMGL